MPATARDIVTLALKEAGVVGVGQTPLAQDINDGYTYLRRMLELWKIKRWNVPALITVNALGNGAVSNTIGTGGHWNTPRPDKIQSAYFTQVNSGDNPVSMPLRAIFSREDYDRVVLKSLNSFPEAFFYDATWAGGLGNVFITPIPSSAYRIYLTVKANLDFPTSLDDQIELPNGYEETIHYNLTIRLCGAYQRPVNPVTAAMAKSGLNAIKVANVQIPQLGMPAALQSPTGFNIYNPDN